MSMAPTTTVANSGMALPIVFRFVWKELRRMRGFAAGVAVLTLGVMLFARAVAPPGDELALRAFVIFAAFCGAAFLAIGSAITAFAVEREEQTDALLYTLPRFWWSTYIGKLIATFALAFGFAAAMTLVAWCVGGGKWPTTSAGWEAVQLGGVLIVEATAWGMLLSLLVPRPLLAAVLACAATSFSSQVAIAIGVAGGRGYQGSDFIEAIPLRLTICGIVFVHSALLARRWMTSVERATIRRRLPVAGTQPATRTKSSALDPAAVQSSLQTVAPTTNSAIVCRLAWQTLRESWRAMLAVVAVGLLLMASIELLVRTAGESLNFELPLTVFFIPGLCGALAFRCDQRRDQYRFLAEHAGRPRLVWLVRVATWGLFLCLLAVPLVIVATVLAKQRVWPHFESLNAGEWNVATIAALRVNTADFLCYGLLSFCLAAFAAFAVGQLASLLLKSEILAAGVALLASVALLLFSYLILAWRLPPATCLLPIAIGCLVASYVRLPDRLVDRHSPGRWAGVVLAVLVPLALVVISISTIRHHQIETAQSPLTTALVEPLAIDVPVNLADPSATLERFLVTRLDEYRRQMHAAAEVTAAYQTVLRSIWDKQLGPYADESPEFGTSDDFQSIFTSQVISGTVVETNPTQVERLARLTEEPAAVVDNGSTWVGNVAALLIADFRLAMNEGDLDRALDRCLSVERLRAQVLHNWTTVPATLLLHNVGLNAVAGDQLLVDWALAPGQTPARIKQAIGDLQAVVQQYPPLDQFVVAQYLRARDVLAGRDTLGSPERPLPTGMALALNSLPGEHQRAEKALELLATLSLHYVDRVGALVGKPLRDQLRFANYPGHDPVGPHGPTILSDSVPYEVMRQRAWQTAASSLIAQETWNTFWGVNMQVLEQVILRTELQLERVRLAIIAYHLDHGEYPETIRELAPDHIAPLAVDPFSGEMFQYAPSGFAPLAFASNIYDTPERKVGAGVPLIWSVGPNYVTPTVKMVDMREHLRDEYKNESEEPIWQTRTVFEPREGWTSSTIALPLPTSDAYPPRTPR